ncbi:MAG: class I SAM-dependent methyltransferase [Desulfovibrionaceae bacterium]
MRYLQTLLGQFSICGGIAELGVFKGEGSTSIFLEHVRENGGSLHSFDLFTDENNYRAVQQKLNLPNTHAVRGYSVEEGLRFRERLDFLFIDGDHGFPRISSDGRQSGVALDILAWHPHLNVGGILVFHDYAGTETEYGDPSLLAVEHAVDSLCREPLYEYVGSEGILRAFRKRAHGVLYPQWRPKKPCEAVRPAWERLNAEPGMFADGAVIFGTGETGKQVLDTLESLCGPDVSVTFTNSSCTIAGTSWGGRPLVPLEQAAGKGPVLMGSIFEQELQSVLEGAGLRHLDDFFAFYEYISWFHVGRLHAATR